MKAKFLHIDISTEFATVVKLDFLLGLVKCRCHSWLLGRFCQRDTSHLYQSANTAYIR